MEPERHEAELDDTDLLAALERAWPVPPMTGRLIARDWSGVSVGPDSASFSAPLLAPPAPRFRPGYRRQSFARIAAILALLLTSVFGVIAFNRNGDHPTRFSSIAAPSPGTAGCSLPLRDTQEVIDAITDLKNQYDAGTITYNVQTYSVFEISQTRDGSQAEVTAFLNEVDRCLANGIPQVSIQAIAPEALMGVLMPLFNDPTETITSITTSLMMTTPEAEADSGPVVADVLTANNGVRLAAFPPDMYGTRFAYQLSQNDQGWQMDGATLITGEWASLNGPVIQQSFGCASPTSIHNDATMRQYLQNQAWLTSAVPLFAVLSQERMKGEAVLAADETAIRRVIDDYRDCLLAGIEPYRFAQGSEQFFGIFASYANAGPDSPIDTLGLEAPVSLQDAAPGEVATVVSLGPDKALAVLAVNPAWQAENKTPAIILVRQNGQWLINQLAIIEGSSLPNR